MKTNNVLLIDKFDPILLIQNRLTFSNTLKELISSLPSELQSVFGVPGMIEYENTVRNEFAVKHIMSMVNLPVILKREEGARVEYSHYFIVCTN
jgi:hypothetical protein